MSVVNIDGELPGLTLSTEGGSFSMSPLPRLHDYCGVIINIHTFRYNNHILTVRYNRPRNIGELKVANLHCSHLQSAVCCNRMVMA